MSTIRHKIAQFTTAALLGLALASPASALFAPAPSVPTDRLITNISAYIEENPEEAQGYYLLARVHYMAFVNRLDHVRSNDPGSAKKLPRLVDPRQYGKAEGEKIKEEKAIEHARAALQLFSKAMELDKDNALYHLGLASFYEQSSPLAKEIAPNPKPAPPAPGVDPPKLVPESELFIKEAAAAYLSAYKLDREAALAKDSVFLPFYPVAYEAGKAYLRLIDQHDIKPEDDKTVGQIKADLAAIDGKPKAITPIVFRIEGDSPRSLNDLIAQDKTVKFDLDADGVAEQRPWVNPDTAILVWDPDNTGRITSGEQLFGNMTFRMLFADGYCALDSLDDNRDGHLVSKELKGLALWHDRNVNGISEPGEVTPLGDTPVRAIATGATGKVSGLHPMNTSGITLDDGTTRPTWDWIIPAAEDMK